MSAINEETESYHMNPSQMLEEVREIYGNRLLRRYYGVDLQDFLLAYHLMCSRWARDRRTAKSWRASQRVDQRFLQMERALWRHIAIEAEGDEFKAIAEAREDAKFCIVCGYTKDLQVDHIVPKSMGGTNHSDNLQILCKSCNCAKGPRTPYEWRQTDKYWNRGNKCSPI